MTEGCGQRCLDAAAGSADGKQVMLESYEGAKKDEVFAPKYL